MLQVSVVIITKNEAENIVECVRSAKTISNDIIVVDAESEDDTAKLAICEGCRVINLKWNGYGNARNTGAANAMYDWILSIDADERITPLLAEKIHRESKNDSTVIYGFKRRNFFSGEEIRYGSLGFDKVWRLYNRNIAFWDTSPVHEKLTGGFTIKKFLKASIDHYTIHHHLHYKNKSIQYGYLCAVKYLQEGKTSTYFKRIFAAAFNFIKSYFFLLGFLDGKKGLSVAKVNAYYTWVKYHHLHTLETEQQKTTKVNHLPFFRINFQSFLK